MLDCVTNGPAGFSANQRRLCVCVCFPVKVSVSLPESVNIA